MKGDIECFYLEELNGDRNFFVAELGLGGAGGSFADTSLEVEK